MARICGNDLRWTRHYPHLYVPYLDNRNTVYAAAKLELDASHDRPEIPGWGVFPKFDQRLVLTDPHGAGLSNWRLPRWFYPDGNKPPLTYHPDRRHWRGDADHAYMRTVGRGQEFVLDIAHYPEAVDWLSDLIGSPGSETPGS